MRLQTKREMAKDGWCLRNPVVYLPPIITTFKQTPSNSQTQDKVMLARQHLVIAVTPEPNVKLVKYALSIGVLTCHCLPTLRQACSILC